MPPAASLFGSISQSWTLVGQDAGALLGQGGGGTGAGAIVAMAIGLLFMFLIAVLGFFFIRYGKLWFQAYMSVADVSLVSLIRMHFTKVNPNVIVQAKVMSAQAGLNISRRDGISTRRLEAHYLAGGNVMNVIHAIIAAHRAEIPLDFDQAAAIDLAGRDALNFAFEHA